MKKLGKVETKEFLKYEGYLIEYSKHIEWSNAFCLGLRTRQGWLL